MQFYYNQIYNTDQDKIRPNQNIILVWTDYLQTNYFCNPFARAMR